MNAMLRRTAAAAFLAAAALPAASMAAAAPMPTTASVAANELSVDLRSIGLSFRGPAGWQRAPELNYSQLARLSRTEGMKLTGLIELQVIPGKGAKPAEMGATVAGQVGGQVAAKPTVTQAPPGTIEIVTKAAGDLPFSRAALFSVRDSFVLVQVATAKSEALPPAFKAVLASVALKAPVAPSEDLTLRKRPLGLFDTAILFSLPEPFRPDSVKDEGNQMFFGVRNWVTGKEEASLQVQVVPNANRAPLGDVAKIMAARITEQENLNPAMTYAKANGKPEAWVSNPFPPTGTAVQRVVLIRMDDDRIATLIFRSAAPDPKTRALYMAMAGQVAESARVSAAYLEGRKAASDKVKK